jgi:uncharacterized damage-inducible protein DinB
MTNLMHDAFRHHAWANDRILEVSSSLTEEQLGTFAHGTRGPILDTLRHLVGSDAWYLWVITGGKVARIDEDHMSVAELREAAKACAAQWEELLAVNPDPDLDVVRTGDDFEFHAPLGLRLAQAVHHGTDHRSQVCTALTSLGIEPPLIDVWDWGEAIGRTREVGERHD